MSWDDAAGYHANMTSLQRTRPAALDGALALATGSSAGSTDVLAPDVQTWLASPEEGLMAVTESVRGAGATAGALARLAPSSLTVAATVASEHVCWAELARSGDGDPETCLVGLTHDAVGRVSRLVWLRAPLVPAAEVDVGAAVPDGRPVLERYFDDLMGSRFGEAAAHFTTDAIYSHPPYGAGTARVLFRGREALRRGFITERGPTAARQVITALCQRRDRVFIEGVVEGIRDGGSFFSTAQITSAGEIARYVAFYSAARIPG